MICWICCASEGNTGEHSVKKSDLKRIFGERKVLDPPLSRRTAVGTQQVPNLESDFLKFDTKICGTCNNVRTQENDKAWEILSNELASRSPKAGDLIDLTSVFKKETHRMMTNVHLYFVKILGCAILDERLAIDIKPFSDAIMKQTCHPGIYLSLLVLSGLEASKFVLNTKVCSDGECQWFMYTAQPISIQIFHSGPGPSRHGMAKSWHPWILDYKIPVNAF